MFIDEAIIKVRAGKGGDGSASFRREKYIPRGGPDGGDGGSGGSVYLRVRDSIHGLAKVIAQKLYQAENGQSGRGKNMYGRAGEDITVDVPPGTIVYEISGSNKTKIADLTKVREEFLVAKGGKGGLGNVHFKSSINRAPREFTPGEPGEAKTLIFEVKHIADIGLVGLPNAGKSTLISRISNARPKVANYPFTTLEPHLGTVRHRGKTFVVADIPGLIEGASQGKGLGHKFLRHLARTKVLIHLISAESQNPKKDYEDIRNELKEFGSDLDTKKEIVMISKSDILLTVDRKRSQKDLKDLNPLFVSSASGEGIDELLDILNQIV